MKTHLMIDIETLDIIPTSIVLSVGAVLFNKNNILEEYYAPLNIFEQILKDRTMSQSTIDFWKKQNDEAKNIGTSVNNVKTCLTILSDLVNNYEELEQVKVWGKGPHFDVSIIESLMRDFDVNIPWKFWNVRDVRTFMEYKNVRKPKDQGVAHNALDDAIYQAKIIQSGLKKGE